MPDENHDSSFPAVVGDSDTISHQTGFDPETASICDVLLSAVASCADTPAESLPILAEVVDPDALEAVIEHQPDGMDRADRSCIFRYAGYKVSVHSKGVLTLSVPNGA